MQMPEQLRVQKAECEPEEAEGALQRPSQTPGCYIYSLFGSLRLIHSVLCSVKPQPGGPTIVSSGVDGTAGAGSSSLHLWAEPPPVGTDLPEQLTNWRTGSVVVDSLNDWLADLQQPVSCASVSRNGPPAELAAVQNPVNRTEQETGCGRVFTFDTSCASHTLLLTGNQSSPSAVQ